MIGGMRQICAAINVRRAVVAADRRLRWLAMFDGVSYQVERVRLGPHLSRNAVRQVLSAHAEYGGWELQRLRRYRDGTRDVWIRRKIIRVTASL